MENSDSNGKRKTQPKKNLPAVRPAGRGAKKKLDKVGEDFVRDRAEKVTDEDIKKVVDKADEIKKKFEKDGPLGRFVSDVYLLIAVVKDYFGGRYREIPYLSIGAIVFALLYVLNPFDLIPDAIPFVGQLDDAVVVGICLIMVEQDLHDYRAWKLRQSELDPGDAGAPATDPVPA